MNPYIEVKDKAIQSRTNYNDPNFVDTEDALFHVFIKDKLLKVLFTVEWHDPGLHQREFQVVRADHLYLDGVDHPVGVTPYTGTISADVSMMNEMFQDNLTPYGIVLDKITVHSKKFIESVRFRFNDAPKREQLYDLINLACKASIKRPN